MGDDGCAVLATAKSLHGGASNNFASCKDQAAAQMLHGAAEIKLHTKRCTSDAGASLGSALQRPIPDETSSRRKFA
jgi:hypothetical protein